MKTLSKKVDALGGSGSDVPGTMIKVLLFGMSDHQGGIESYYRKVLDNMNMNIIEFSFVSFHSQMFLEDYFSSLGLNIYHVPTRKEGIIRHYLALARMFKQGQFDVLHVSVNTLSYAAIIWCALAYNVKVIVHSHSSGCTGKLSTVMHYINRCLLNIVYVNRIAVSEPAGKWLYGKKADFTIIHNAVDSEKYKFDMRKRQHIRKMHNLKDSDIVIGTIGHLNQIKNQKFLIHLLVSLSQDDNRYYLMIVGDGPMKDELKKLAKEMSIEKRVFLTGVQNDIQAYLSAMDIFVMPSLFEGFPLVLLEAQTSGLPCYFTDTITDEVKILENCESLPLNKERWAQCILKCNKSPDQKRENAYIEVQEAGFSIKEVVKKLEGLYSKGYSE